MQMGSFTAKPAQEQSVCFTFLSISEMFWGGTYIHLAIALTFN